MASPHHPEPAPNRDLDRTLHALGTATPASGFEQRLKTRLAQPAPTRAQRPRARFAAYMAALTAALCSLTFTLHHLTPPPPSSKHPNSKLETSQLPNSRLETQRIPFSPAANLTPTPSSLTPSHLIPQQHPLRPDISGNPIHLELTRPTPTPSSLIPSHLIPQQHPLRPDISGNPIHLELTRLTPTLTNDDTALADLHTPSYPAPPRDDTAQERALRLMLRRGERHDLAQLDAHHLDLTRQQDAATFSQFFDPPIDPRLLNQPRSLASTPAEPTR